MEKLCVICDKQLSEASAARDKAVHPQCFFCYTCKKVPNSRKHELVGKQIYCKPCGKKIKDKSNNGTETPTDNLTEATPTEETTTTPTDNVTEATPTDNVTEEISSNENSLRESTIDENSSSSQDFGVDGITSSLENLIKTVTQHFHEKQNEKQPPLQDLLTLKQPEFEIEKIPVSKWKKRPTVQVEERQTFKSSKGEAAKNLRDVISRIPVPKGIISRKVCEGVRGQLEGFALVIETQTIPQQEKLLKPIEILLENLGRQFGNQSQEVADLLAPVKGEVDKNLQIVNETRQDFLDEEDPAIAEEKYKTYMAAIKKLWDNIETLILELKKNVLNNQGFVGYSSTSETCAGHLKAGQEECTTVVEKLEMDLKSIGEYQEALEQQYKEFTQTHESACADDVKKIQHIDRRTNVIDSLIRSLYHEREDLMVIRRHTEDNLNQHREAQQKEKEDMKKMTEENRELVQDLNEVLQNVKSLNDAQVECQQRLLQSFSIMESGNSEKKEELLHSTVDNLGGYHETWENAFLDTKKSFRVSNKEYEDAIQKIEDLGKKKKNRLTTTTEKNELQKQIDELTVISDLLRQFVIFLSETEGLLTDHFLKFANPIAAAIEKSVSLQSTYFDDLSHKLLVVINGQEKWIEHAREKADRLEAAENLKQMDIEGQKRKIADEVARKKREELERILGVKQISGL